MLHFLSFKCCFSVAGVFCGFCLICVWCCRFSYRDCRIFVGIAGFFVGVAGFLWVPKGICGCCMVFVGVEGCFAVVVGLFVGVEVFLWVLHR